jgi:hypothetical protein
MSNDGVNNIFKKLTGPLPNTKELQKLPHMPGQPGQHQPKIGSDKDGRGFDPTSGMRGTGQLPKLDAKDIPDVANTALDGLRKGTGMLKHASKTLGQIEDQLQGAAGDASQAFKSAEKFASGDIAHDIKGGIIGVTSLRQLAVSGKTLVKGEEIAAEAGKLGKAAATAEEVGVEGAEIASKVGEVSKFAKVAAGVGFVAAVYDAQAQARQIAGHWDDMNDAQRASSVCYLTSDALTMAGTFAPPPADAVLLGAGAAFALGGLAADYWPEISSGAKAAGKEIGKEAKELGRDAGKALDHLANSSFGKQTTQAAHDVAKVEQKAEKAVSHAAKSVGKKLKHLF